MFLATVMCGNSAYDWNIRLIGRRFGCLPSRSSPSSVTVPLSGVSKPAMMRSSVVLPQPDGPSRAKNSPCPISSETPSSAVTSPNLRVTPSILST